MFNDFKTTILICVALIMGLMLAIGSVSISSLKAKNADLNAEIVNAQVSVNALVSSNDNKDERIKTLEREYRVITELNTSHRNQVATLESALDTKLASANKMGNSEHEPTKTWANADLPSDALQLLKQADCQSSDTDQHGVCATAD